MMNQLDKLEKRFRTLFETGSAWNSSSDENDRLVHELSIAIQDLFISDLPRDQYTHPLFQINLHPGTLHRWKEKTDWEKQLTDLLVYTASEFGINFLVTPGLKLVSDETLKPEEVVIDLKESARQPLSETRAVALDNIENLKTGENGTIGIPMLILPGDRTIPLTRSVINIGRKSTNEIVIKDLRVSRTHAQIRKVKGDYEIFDIGSTGGTFINSNRIDQKVLRPGDVISLAGYIIIYTIDQVPVEQADKGITSEIKCKEEKGET